MISGRATDWLDRGLEVFIVGVLFFGSLGVAFALVWGAFKLAKEVITRG